MKLELEETDKLTESPAGGVQTGVWPRESRCPGPSLDSGPGRSLQKPEPTPTNTGQVCAVGLKVCTFFLIDCWTCLEFTR